MFWFMMPYSLTGGYRRFEEPYCPTFNQKNTIYFCDSRKISISIFKTGWFICKKRR
jgi:hypothetical protein